MTWARLDDGLLTHPKAMAAGIEGRALFVASILYSARELTDGQITGGAIAALAGLAGVRNAKKTTELLVSLRLWDIRDGSYWVHDYLDYNPSRADVMAKREADSLNGKKGAVARWGSPGHSRPDSQGHDEGHGQPDGQTMPPYPVPVPVNPVSPTAAAARANERVPDALNASGETTAAWAEATGQNATRQITDAMKRWIERAGLEWVIDAIHETGSNSSRAWSYTEAILQRWERDGHKPRTQSEPEHASSWSDVNDLDARRLRGEDISADVAANRAAADAELARQMAESGKRKTE